MGGYFGYPHARGEFWSRLYVEALPSANIQNISRLAEASGYETILIAEPPDNSPYPPSVAIKNRVILYPFMVPIDFTITVLENGYLTVAVNSDYYLREAWMRNVFKRMLQDINLPPSIITSFELHENRRIHLWNMNEPWETAELGH